MIFVVLLFSFAYLSLLLAGFGECFGQFLLQGFEFTFEGGVFGFFALDVAARECHALLHTFGGEHVGGFAELLVGFEKSAEFEEAFFEQGVNDEVGLPQAHANGGCKLALAVFRVLFEGFEQAKVGLLVWGHEWL
jgi:hypothetical protein